MCVIGALINERHGTREYYIKSKKLKDYKTQILDYLAHPPLIEINPAGCVKAKGSLYINHVFEGKQLITPYIDNVMRGLYFLWGGNVLLETSEIEKATIDAESSPSPLWRAAMTAQSVEENKTDITWGRVIYTITSDKKVTRRKK